MRAALKRVLGSRLFQTSELQSEFLRFTVEKTLEGKASEVYLKDALVTHVQLSGSNENPTESLGFAFQGMEIAYKAEYDDGSLDGATPKGFDLATLRPDFAAPLPF